MMEKTIKLQIIGQDITNPVQFKVLKELTLIRKPNYTIQRTVLLDDDEQVWMLEITASLGSTITSLRTLSYASEYYVEII